MCSSHIVITGYFLTLCISHTNTSNVSRCLIWLAARPVCHKLIQERSLLMLSNFKDIFFVNLYNFWLGNKSKVFAYLSNVFILAQGLTMNLGLAQNAQQSISVSWEQGLQNKPEFRNHQGFLSSYHAAMSQRSSSVLELNVTITGWWERLTMNQWLQIASLLFLLIFLSTLVLRFPRVAISHDTYY